MRLPIFIDIDGTLTSEPYKMWGPPLRQRIAKVAELIRDGRHEVVIWSGGGTAYARSFANHYGLNGAVCIGKPDACVDDNPHIRPRARMAVISPDEYFA